MSLNEYLLFDKNGLLHSYDDLSARMIMSSDGKAVLLEWYEHGLLHRRNEPAVIRYGNNIIVEKIWYYKGKIHTFDKRPALIKYYPGTDFPMLYQWFKFGKPSRHDGKPTTVYYYPDKYKLISAKSWVIDDVTNRLDRSKPYYIKYNKLGNIIHSSFFLFIIPFYNNSFL